MQLIILHLCTYLNIYFGHRPTVACNMSKIIVAIIYLIRSQAFVQISPSSFGTRILIDSSVNEL